MNKKDFTEGKIQIVFELVQAVEKALDDSRALDIEADELVHQVLSAKLREVIEREGEKAVAAESEELKSELGTSL
jgi:uncharacterized protein YbaP (TraB family)